MRTLLVSRLRTCACVRAYVRRWAGGRGGGAGVGKREGVTSYDIYSVSTRAINPIEKYRDTFTSSAVFGWSVASLGRF
jgi:hypothetical protein